MGDVVKRGLVLASLTVMLGAGPVLGETMDRRSPSGIELAKRATVGILQPGEEAQNQGGRAHFTMRGTGVHIRDGYILTARHVVERDERGKKVMAKQITVMTVELEEASATLIGDSNFLDIALYRVSGDLAARLPDLSFAGSEPVPGDEVFTIGYPLGWGPVIGFGRVGNPNIFLPIVDTRLFQLDLAVCGGNSGGGVFTTTGALVGVMHAMIQAETGQSQERCSRLAFAAPGSLVQRVVTAFIQGAQPSFSRLGVGLTAVKMGSRWRVAASEVIGPAREAGIQKGDVLLAIENMEILDGAQLKNYLIERTTPGQRVTVKVLRGQQEHLLQVTLGKS